MRFEDNDDYQDDTLDGDDHNDVDIDIETAIDKELALLQETLLTGGSVDVETWLELVNNEI